MKLFAAGTEPKGIIAVGQQATGVVAIGQLATGVIAIGQLARGVIAVGQLAVGVVAFGQAALGVFGGGMVGLVGFRSRASLLVFGVAGDAGLRRDRRWAPFARLHRRWQPALTALRVVLLVAISTAVVLIALSWLPGFFDEGDVIRLRPPAPPGSR